MHTRTMAAFRLALSLGACLSLAAASLAGAATQPIGSEVRINSGTTFQPRKPLAVYHNDGSFTVIWENDQLGLIGRRFQANGTPLGTDFTLVSNDRLPGDGIGPVIYRYEPAAVSLPNGGYFLAWAEERAILHLQPFNEWREVQQRDILMQRFNAQGHPVGNRIVVTTDTSSFHGRPSLAFHRRHGVMVVWESNRQDPTSNVYGIFARRFDLQGNAINAPERINDPSGVQAARPEVAVNNEGRFLVVWEGCCSDGDRTGVFARIFGRNGQPVGTPFLVNTGTVGVQRRPAVAADTSNRFFVVWQGRYETPLSARIFGQVVDRSGQLVGPEVQVSSGDWGGTAQTAPSVMATPAGGYFVIWIDYNETFPIGTYGLEVDGFGNPQQTELKLSAAQVGAQYQSSLVSNGHNELLAVWEGYHASRRGITALRMSTTPDRGDAHGLTVAE